MPRKIVEPLSITNPDLIEEWDYEKNLDVFPNRITKTSLVSVWWKCSYGHSWSATIRARTRGTRPTGCPYCAGIRCISGKNDLATLYPELLKEWDYDANLILPSEVTAHSGQKVHWKCSFCGHKWDACVSNRTSNKRGCPNCSMKCTSFAEQAIFYYIKMVFPSAINRYSEHGFELDIYIPEIKVGIEYDGSYFHSTKESYARDLRKYKSCKENGIWLIRVSESNSIRKDISDVSYGIENIKSHEKLTQLIRLLIKDLDPKSNFWLREKPSQIWSSIDSLIDVERDYFDIVSDRRIRAVENSVFCSHPDLLEEWDGDLNGQVNPFSVTSGSGVNYHWKCKVCGYKWMKRVPDRLRGDKCPCCSGKVLVEGVNDFATLYPEGLEEWDYENNTISPSKVISKRVKYNWICKKCGYRWSATISDRFVRTKRTGCPMCARRRG